ncbi:unnamed protein product [Tetraodon nigroviridis]|uniref:Galectin n=1 Tax=Tetraodon nigroviridis TaxID=99883 RepID=Q4TIT1_TETNG|nr:unnamed protein product [Tetraodon nigroviridis]
MSMLLELKNVRLRTGDQLKIKGFVLKDADRFRINLGSDEENLALHFNPRFSDTTDESVLVFNSRKAGSWGEERKESPNPLHRGRDAKIVLKLAGDVFKVELPDGHKFIFPNRENVDVISYIGIGGDFKLTSFKIC